MLRVNFDGRIKLEFHGAAVTSDAGLMAYRELDEAMGLAEMGEAFRDSHRGKNKQHELVGLLRQSVYSRLAGYEDKNIRTHLVQLKVPQGYSKYLFAQTRREKYHNGLWLKEKVFEDIVRHSGLDTSTLKKYYCTGKLMSYVNILKPTLIKGYLWLRLHGHYHQPKQTMGINPDRAQISFRGVRQLLTDERRRVQSFRDRSQL